MAFKRAERKSAKLRIALAGPAGSGKTWNAIQIAKVMGQKVAVIDSEKKSASLYARLPDDPEPERPGAWDFDVSELEETNTWDYIAQIQEAAVLGYDALVIDSYSHSWTSALDRVDRNGGWVRAGKDVSPAIRRLVDAILNYPGHVIVTLRSKAEHVIEQNAQGKTVVRKVGMATVARDGTDYEFSVMLDLALDGTVGISKTRCAALAGNDYRREDIPKIAAQLKAWLESAAPLSAREEFERRIKFTQTVDDLQKLVPEIEKLTAPDKKALGPTYLARKLELASRQPEPTA
jgi:hypothetical protein